MMNIPELKRKESIKHRDKIQSLKAVDEEMLTKVGPPLKSLVTESSFSLGKGSMGTCVYVGIMDDGSEVAVKRMLIQASKDTAENEREILTLIKTKKSPFIVSYRHFLQDKMFMYLILDLCEEALDDHVYSQSNEQLHENGRRMIREIFTGLKFLHDQGILHRDLKPSNVLVDVEGHMRLTDFGISRVLNEDETTVQTNAKGTQGWMPAEVIETSNRGGKGGFKKKSDVQVAGMIAYFILSKGEHPFGPSYDRMSNIVKGNPVYLKKLSDLGARKFIAKLIRHKITDRPYAHEALGHIYINTEIECGQTSEGIQSDKNRTSNKEFQLLSSPFFCYDDNDNRDEHQNDQSGDVEYNEPEVFERHYGSDDDYPADDGENYPIDEDYDYSPPDYNDYEDDENYSPSGINDDFDDNIFDPSTDFDYDGGDDHMDNDYDDYEDVVNPGNEHDDYEDVVNFGNEHDDYDPFDGDMSGPYDDSDYDHDPYDF